MLNQDFSKKMGYGSFNIENSSFHMPILFNSTIARINSKQNKILKFKYSLLKLKTNVYFTFHRNMRFLIIFIF